MIKYLFIKINSNIMYNKKLSWIDFRNHLIPLFGSQPQMLNKTQLVLHFKIKFSCIKNLSYFKFITSLHQDNGGMLMYLSSIL